MLGTPLDSSGLRTRSSGLASGYSSGSNLPSKVDMKVNLQVMSGDDMYTMRSVILPVIVGRPTGSSGLVPSAYNCLFNNSLISRKHASLFLEHGLLWVTDLGSSNGTYVNGILLKAHSPYRLNDGDLLQFGIDDGFDSVNAGGRKEQVVVLQVKLPRSSPSIEPEIPKKIFSPGRILQEARLMLSRSSARLPSSQSVMLSSASRIIRPAMPPHRSVYDLSSSLIALAQRLVETAESAKIYCDDEGQNFEVLSDLAGNVEISLAQYREDKSRPDYTRTTNLVEARRIIRTYEIAFCILAVFFLLYMFL